MPRFRPILQRLRGLFRRRSIESEMNEELRGHLDALTERNLAAGLSPEDARNAALRAFGGVAQIEERARDERRSAWGEQVWQDLRYAARALRRTPGFTAISIVILALGIGANTAVFTFIDRAMLRKLPVNNPDQLVIVTKPDARAPRTNESFSFPAYAQLRDRTQTLAGLAAFRGAIRTMAITGPGGGEAGLIQTQDVTGNFFSVLGVAAVVGRTLSPSDDAPDNPQPVVVLSHALWQQRFGSSPDAIGKTIVLDDVSFTIVGVASRRFLSPSLGGGPDLWLPLQMVQRLEPRADRRRFQNDESQWLFVIGRLKPRVDREAARAELDVIFQNALTGFGWSDAQRKFLGGRIELQPGAFGYDRLGPETKPLLTLLFGLVGLVLLLACANVAGLLFARAAVRQRELAVRSALGASRGRLVRQLLVESLLLAVAGGLLGVLFAQWGTHILAAQFPRFDLNPDVPVLLFTAVVSVVAGIAIGLSPAVRLSRIDLVSALKAQAIGGSRPRLNQVLVAGQIALSVCLLAVAGLCVRTLQNLRGVDLGFNGKGLLVFIVEFGNYYDAAYRANFFQEVQAAGLDSLPGVISATTADGYMFFGDTPNDGKAFNVEGEVSARGATMLAQPTLVGPGYFETFGLPLIRGRDFGPSAVSPAGASSGRSPGAVVVINDMMARALFGDRDPLGRVIRFVEPALRWPPFEIVGVAADSKYGSLREKNAFRVYLPYWHMPTRQRMWFQLRTTGDPQALAPRIRQIIQRVDPKARVLDPRTMDDMVEGSLAPERTIAQAASFFSVLALALACMGLYGLLAYSVTQRTREIGVRMALGADRRNVLGLVVGHGLRLALCGCVVGLVGAVAFGRLLANRLYEVSAADPLTILATTGLLLSIALLACWLPARRATKVDPMVALRAE